MTKRKISVAFIAFLFIFTLFAPYSSAKTISRHAGIGDTRASFNKAYGHGKSSSGIVRYKHDYILAMFMDHAAYDIELQFEQTSKPRRTLSQVNTIYKEFIPSDSRKIKQYYDSNVSGTVMIFHSNNLAKHVKKEVFSGAKKGTFLVVLQRNKHGYFGISIGTGDNP